MKLTTPLETLVKVNHGWSLDGANGPDRFNVEGKTTGNAVLPPAGLTDFADGLIKAFSRTLTAPL